MIEGFRIIKQLHEKYDSDLHTKLLLNNLEKEIDRYTDIESDYKELKEDWENMVGQKEMKDYFRDLCGKLQKEIEELRKENAIWKAGSSETLAAIKIRLGIE